MRLDFNTFAISGPSTNTLSIGKITEGELNTVSGFDACARGQCQTDTFTITSPSTTPPVICGTNSGEHSKMVTHSKDFNHLDHIILYDACVY